ncbi:MAG: 8-oxo-dGTP diphosphatase [Candidatus Moraniibacteriota bacterium]|nr:MAG: 8-oxo-dGTP diphosphatase [Candidatus Moranbacteria bacterium]
MKKRLFTLCLATKEGKILLGMKKRGFGMGRWNGFGGKVEAGETIPEAARREMFEECGVGVENMEYRGVHEFIFESRPDEIMVVHIFCVDSFVGFPEETDEMKPKWFNFENIPYKDMWADDEYWFPLFLENKKFQGKFYFGKGDKILSQELKEVSDLPSLE